jgi:hypothetical protein
MKLPGDVTSVINVLALIATPDGVSRVIGPLVALIGTVVTSLLVPIISKADALASLNLRRLPASEEAYPSPTMVTIEPALPPGGEK